MYRSRYLDWCFQRKEGQKSTRSRRLSLHPYKAVHRVIFGSSRMLRRQSLP